MKIAGIIAEYNPFHKGHQYQLETLRKLHNVDYIIVAMSGDFVQRGTPALLNKYARARMSLLQGADLILELPACFATSSAEGFARGGIGLLHTAGIVDCLCFGAESGDLERLQELAELLAEEPKWYRDAFRNGLKQGLSFPAARAKALPEYADQLALPNNILALEYLKAIRALDATLTPVLIQRKGSGYHDTEIAGPFSSASAIREKIRESGKKQEYSERSHGLKQPDTFENKALSDALPSSSLRIMAKYQKEAAFLNEDDFSLLLHHTLLGETPESLLRFADMSEALASRIIRNREHFRSWSQFCQLCDTRDMTYARISRVLSHILLDIRAGQALHKENPPADAAAADKAPYLPYLRVLGFKKSAEPLFGLLKARAKAPVITAPAMGTELLDAYGLDMLNRDIYASDLYRSVLTEKTGKAFPTEYRRRLLVINT